MMKLKLNKEIYNADGSSLSQTRCNQIVLVFEMLEKIGAKVISYIDIQEEAEKNKLFGSTKAKNAIRTFFPLLKKINFVKYEDSFPANKCFTELGRQFVLACRALKNVTEQTPNRELVAQRLSQIKQNAQKQGLINMNKNPEFANHNIWLALKLLKEFQPFDWSCFLYALHLKENNRSIEEIIMEIKTTTINLKDIEYVSEKGKPLPNTCYSYIRSFLEEADVIDSNSNLKPGANLFYSQITI